MNWDFIVLFGVKHTVRDKAELHISKGKDGQNEGLCFLIFNHQSLSCLLISRI